MLNHLKAISFPRTKLWIIICAKIDTLRWNMQSVFPLTWHGVSTSWQPASRVLREHEENYNYNTKNWAQKNATKSIFKLWRNWISPCILVTAPYDVWRVCFSSTPEIVTAGGKYLQHFNGHILPSSPLTIHESIFRKRNFLSFCVLKKIQQPIINAVAWPTVVTDAYNTDRMTTTKIS